MSDPPGLTPLHHRRWSHGVRPGGSDTSLTRRRGVGEEQLLAVDGVRLDGVLPFLRDEPVDELLALLLLDVGVLGGIDEDDPVLVEELPVALDHSFELPRDERALREDAVVSPNRKRLSLTWRVDIRTPGLPGDSRRLGDLRLECEVSAAVKKEEIPLLYRAGALAAGGLCNLPMVGYIYRAPKRIVSASVVSGERKAGLPLHGNGEGYHAPLRDKSWDDEALIVVEFAEPTLAAQP